MAQALSRRLISVEADAPPGFEHIAEPGRKEIRGGLVALWTRNPDALIERLGSTLERMRGVILCPGAAAGEGMRLGASVWRFEVASERVDELASFAEACLQLCADQVEAKGELGRLKLELERARVDMQRLVEKVDQESRDMRMRMVARKEWTAAAMTALVRFVAEEVPGLDDAVLPAGIVGLLTREPLALASASMWCADEAGWQRVAHRGTQEIEAPPIGLDADHSVHEGRTHFYGLRVAGRQAVIGVSKVRPLDAPERSVLALCCVQLSAIYRQRELNVALGRAIADKDALIAELSTPLIEVWRDTVCLPIIGSVEAERVEAMTQVLLDAVAARGIRNVIVDFTGLVHVDTQTASLLSGLVSAIGLLGARCLLTGISPAVARTLVVLGVEISGASTLRTVEAALVDCVAASVSSAGELR